MTDIMTAVWFALAMIVVLGCGVLLMKVCYETEPAEESFDVSPLPPAEPWLRRVFAPEAVMAALALALSVTIVCLT